ncbi:YycC family protein [Paenibacillus sp. FSL W7-1287]|uniref:YycC family protein n=1 Tax=Paenibacillus sp. FSL W7-1287 TaxID=2954538 RepID=UPI0030F7FE87
MLKQLSPDTAIKLAKELGIPIEQLVHTPRHIVLAKLAELAKKQTPQPESDEQEESNKESDA